MPTQTHQSIPDAKVQDVTSAVRVTITLPEELWDTVKIAAIRRKLVTREFVERALRRELKNGKD